MDSSSTGGSASAGTTTEAPTSFTQAQWAQVQSAIDQAFQGVQGGSFTNQQIYQNVLSNLRSLGWNDANLGVIAQALGVWANDTATQTDYVKHGKSNTTADEQSWWGRVQSQALSIFGSNLTNQPAQPPAATTDPNLANLISSLTQPVQAPPSQLATPYSVPTSGTSPGPFLWLGLLAALGLVGWWWYTKHKVGHAVAHAAVHAATHHEKDVDG